MYDADNYNEVAENVPKVTVLHIQLNTIIIPIRLIINLLIQYFLRTGFKITGGGIIKRSDVEAFVP